MACSQYEIAIMEYLENQLPADQRQELEKHLKQCSECRDFAHELRAVDAALSRQIQPPVLSADFTARLERRLQHERVAMSAEQRAARKQQFEAEFNAGMTHLQRSLWGILLLDGLGLTALATLVGAAFWSFSKSYAAAGTSQSVTLLTATGAVCLLAGCAAALTPSARRYFTGA